MRKVVGIEIPQLKAHVENQTYQESRNLNNSPFTYRDRDLFKNNIKCILHYIRK